MDNPTEKFREKLKSAKESQNRQQETTSSMTSFVAISVGIVRALLIYFSYNILSTKFPSLVKFTFWEGMVIIFGALSLLTLLRNHIKAVFANEKK